MTDGWRNNDSRGLGRMVSTVSKVSGRRNANRPFAGSQLSKLVAPAMANLSLLQQILKK